MTRNSMLRSHASIRAFVLAGLCISSGAAMALPERLSGNAQDALTRLRSNAGGALQQRALPAKAYTRVHADAARTLMADNAFLKPADRARFFLSVYGAALGLSDSVQQLALNRISTDSAGNTHVHLDQVHGGLPVFGARVVVHMNGAGITGVNGVFVPGLENLSTAPTKDLSTLRAAALAYAAKFNPRRSLRIEGGQWLVYPAGLLQGRLGESRLAYEAMVIATSGSDVRERVFVDANTGVLLNRINEIHSALNREIYTPDMSGPPTMDDSPTSLIPPGPADPALINDPGHNSTETSSRPGNSPQANLWIFAGGTYALYNNMFGRGGYDACDGFGPCKTDVAGPDWSPTRPADYVGQIQKSVYLINDACPNAYWNGSSTNYCPGFDADDVVSHEWSHAYTQYTHGLIYQYQSGALNESWSDIFGETYDLVNDLEGQPGATLEENKYWVEGGSRWVVGEDLSEEAAAALLRDMWQPDDFCGTLLCAQNPGKATSANYTCGSGDNGGVHANSSVSNHAYAMLVDGTAGQGPGDAYNGQSFTGIGMVKAAHIYFHAQTNYQTPTTDFPQHADALRSSCQDLKNGAVILKGTTGVLSGQIITQADCDVLEKAMLATEMDLGAPCPFTPVLQPNPPAVCGGAADLFAEDWESGDDGWTKTSAGVFAEWEDSSRSVRDFLLDSSLPSSRPGTAALARNLAIGEPGGGDCSPGTGDYSGQYTYDGPNIVIPAGATDLKLRFDHLVATEATFDGGQIELSVNGGAFALVPQTNYVFNKPNSALDDPPPIGLNTNPNAGEFAWNGADINAPSGSPPGSWGTTVVDLTGLAAPGDTVKLRLTFSQDGCNGVEGWYVDDIRLYSCPSLAAPTVTLGADYEAPDTDGTFTLNWVRPFGATGPDLVQESEVCGPLITEDAENGFGNWVIVRSDPAISPNWETSVAQPNHGSTTFWANPTSEQETQGSSASLTYVGGIAIPADGETFLRFSEWYFNEQDDKGIVQVSVNNGPWTSVYTNTRNGDTDVGAAALADEDLVPVEVDLTPYAGQAIRLRFLFELGPSNFFVETQYGWYIDDISVVNDNWGDLLTTSDTSYTLTNQSNGTRCYRVRTAYDVSGDVIPGKFSGPLNATVNINLPPIAVATGPSSVTEGEAGDLSGTTSSDPNGDALTYAWTQEGGPDVTWTSATSAATASFTVPTVCANVPLTFRLTVTDPDGLTAFADVFVTGANVNTPPDAVAGSDFTIDEGRGVRLDAAAGTNDPDCETLTYSWAQVGGPDVGLANPSSAVQLFTAPAVITDTPLVFRLTVTDDAGASNSDDIIVTVLDVVGQAEGPAIGNNTTGALPQPSLLILGLLGLLRGRRRHLTPA